MFTPQEIQEKTFVKAVFGGYDMNSVDEFLEPLTTDYIALYKENAVLKSKMKILVEKLEEYRAQEETMKKTMVAATEVSEKLKADTERKCAQMLSQAENAVRMKNSEASQQIAAEDERIERAKQTAENFIAIIEREVNRHLEQLASLKRMNLAARQIKAQPYDFDREPPATPVPSSSEPEDPKQIANEIGQNLEKVIGPTEDGIETGVPPAPISEPVISQPVAASPKKPVSQATIKFSDLQFGKNYDPNARK